MRLPRSQDDNIWFQVDCQFTKDVSLRAPISQKADARPAFSGQVSDVLFQLLPQQRALLSVWNGQKRRQHMNKRNIAWPHGSKVLRPVDCPNTRLMEIDADKNA